MSEQMTAGKADRCQYCGMLHPWAAVCPSVKAFEYYPNGTVKRVEFRDHQPVTSATMAGLGDRSKTD